MPSTSEIKFKETEIGMIPEDWIVDSLSNFVSHRKGFAFKSSWYGEGGYKIVKVSNLTENSIELSKCGHLIKEKTDEFIDWSLNEGDIIISTVGSWPNNPASIVGKVIRVPKLQETCLLNQNAVRLRSTKLDQLFLYYIMKNKSFTGYLIGNAQGSANQASITLQDIFSYKFAYPKNLSEQKRIANILFTLDNKINNLNNKNSLLEEIGRILFTKYFLEERKDNWNKKNIQEVLEFEKGVEPGSNCYEKKRSNLNELFVRVGYLNNPNREEIFIPLNLAKDKKCLEEDILISLDATIGIVKVGFRGAFSGGIRKVYCKNKQFSGGLIYFLLKSDQVQNDIIKYAIGTTIIHASSSLNHMNIFVPNKKTLQEINSYLDPLLKKIICNLKEISRLSDIRDSLLPKLMMGKIRMPLI